MLALFVLASLATATTYELYCTNQEYNPLTQIIAPGDTYVISPRLNAQEAKYSTYATCGWILSCEGNCALRVVWSNVNIEALYDFARLYDGYGTSGGLHGQYTGSATPSAWTTSSSDMTITFTSDSSVEYVGFTATVTVVAPPASVMRHLGTTLPPASATSYSVKLVGTTQYLDEMDVSSTITTSDGSAVKITFGTTFATEAGLDLVIIYDGPTTDSGIIAAFSGSRPSNPVVTSTSNAMTIRFVSSPSFTYSGFSFGVIQATVAPRTYALLGESVTLSSTPKTVKLIGRSDATYFNEMTRQHTFVADEGFVVELTLASLNTELNYDFFNVYDGAAAGYSETPMLKVSGPTLPSNPTVRSTGRELTVLFTSDVSIVSSGPVFAVSQVASS